jgi:hypothetical protein
MSIENIKKKLDSLGYHTYVSSDRLIVGKDLGAAPEIGGSQLKNFCSITEEKNTFSVEFGRSNLPEWKDFTSESKVVNFIKTTFPL